MKNNIPASEDQTLNLYINFTNNKKTDMNWIERTNRLVMFIDR